MKKLLVLLVLLPQILLGQQDPIERMDRNYACSVERTIVKKKIKSEFKPTLSTHTQKEAIDPIEYLLSNSFDEVYSFLRDYNRSGQTDIFSDQNTLKVVQYFKDEVIQLIDPQLTDETPSKFIAYFRAYDWQAWYQSDVTYYEPYIDALFDALGDLYNYEPYWEKTGELNGFRWNSTLVLDIEKYRIRAYDLIILNLEKSTDDFVGAETPQVDHLNALSSLIWRAFANNDSEFIERFATDTHAHDLIFNIIDNDVLANNESYNTEYISFNFIRTLGTVFNKLTEYPNIDVTDLVNQAIEQFNQTQFGENRHMHWVANLINVNYDLGIDFNQIKQDYFDLEFGTSVEYDNGTIKIYSAIDSTRIESIYLDVRQTRANFFKLTGDKVPVEGDLNETINFYIFQSPERYDALGNLLFNIPTNNGGIYIENNSAFYTFDREDDYLPINFLVNHEYTHYLDGRYNIHGTFGELEFYDWDTGRYVFWTEGLAGFVGSANRKTGWNIAYSNASQVANDVNENSTITLKESIRTSYSNWRMYAYSDAAWGFLYENLHEELMELFSLVKQNNIQEYFSKLDDITFDLSLEPLYQEYLIQIKDKFESGLTDHEPLISYDFSEPIISNDSIQFAFNNIGLKEFQLETSYQNPFEYIAARKDTLVSSIKEVDEYIQTIIKQTDSIEVDYTGYKILLGQIDSFEKVDNQYKVYYSLELPVNGSFIHPEDPVDPDPEDPVDPEDPDPDPEDPVDPIDPVDPVDPVDPEPVITEFILYPNPTVSEINVTGLPDNSDIYIYDIQGRVRFSTKHQTGVFKQNVSRLETGIYIFVYRSTLGMKSIKFIKR